MKKNNNNKKNKKSETEKKFKIQLNKNTEGFTPKKTVWVLFLLAKVVYLEKIQKK